MFISDTNKKILKEIHEKQSKLTRFLKPKLTKKELKELKDEENQLAETVKMIAKKHELWKVVELICQDKAFEHLCRIKVLQPFWKDQIPKLYQSNRTFSFKQPSNKDYVSFVSGFKIYEKAMLDEELSLSEKQEFLEKAAFYFGHFSACERLIRDTFENQLTKQSNKKLAIPRIFKLAEIAIKNSGQGPGYLLRSTCYKALANYYQWHKNYQAEQLCRELAIKDFCEFTNNHNKNDVHNAFRGYNPDKKLSSFPYIHNPKNTFTALNNLPKNEKLQKILTIIKKLPTNKIPYNKIHSFLIGSKSFEILANSIENTLIATSSKEQNIPNPTILIHN